MKNEIINNQFEEDDTAGGKGGTIEFRDFISSGETLRDDLLPPDVIKRMISVHQDTNEMRVKKQKELGDQRALLKSGKIPLTDYRQSLNNNGMQAQYKAHPKFQHSPQFHDPQVTSIPSENISQTNDELKNELTNEFQLKYQPEQKYQNKLTHSTPRLIR